MNTLSGTSKLNQKRITAIHNAPNHTISIEEVAIILKMPNKEVAKLMSRWVEQGWFARIKRGLYVPIKSDERNSPADDPWIIATKIYNPCYIGALSAAKYWGFTDQKLKLTHILSMQKPRNRNPVINGSHFSVRTISQQAMFGLELTARENIDVLVSDPSRTIIDFMTDPQLGGGIDNVFDMFNRYLKSKHRNADLLYSYAKKTLNGAVLKRLGFLLERSGSCEFNIIRFCQKLITDGYIKLDPAAGGNKLITRWGLWI